MADDVRLGLWLDTGSRLRTLDHQLRRHIEVIAVAERSGFESVWVGETYAFGMPAPLQWLAALASHTSLRLGTGVLLLPTWNPLRLAAETAVIDGLSGGRFELGVGVGRRHVQTRFGVDPTTVATFADEVLEMLRVMWAGGNGFSGSIVRVEGPVDPRPVQRGGPPIWVGGAIRRSVLRAATFGDGWYASTTYSTAQIAVQADRYRAELATRANGTPVRIAANRLALVAPTDEAAEDLAVRYLGPVLRRYATNGSLGEAWRTDPATPEATYRRLRDEYCLVGSPATVATRLAEYRAIGVTDIHARAFPDEAPLAVAIQTTEGMAEAARLARG